MEIKKLRIGNFIYSRNDDYSVKAKKGWDLTELLQINMNGSSYCNFGTEVGKKHIDSNSCGYVTENCELKPILITEEWLLKLGFVEHKFEDGIYGFCNRGVNYIKSGQIRFGNESLLFNDDKHLLHVQQLQNLYFALLGEELTIK